MPRKLRTPKARRDIAVSLQLMHFLTWRDWDAAAALARPEDSRWTLFDGVGPHAHAVAWEAIADVAVEAWIEKHPGTRPASWWFWSAPELRQIFGRFAVVQSGRERCRETGLPFGTPADLDDLPMVETEAGFLERCRLWRPGERARVPAEALAPVRFSWALMKPPNLTEDDDEMETGAAHLWE